MKLKIFTLLLSLLICSQLSATTLANAKELYLSGNYDKALPLFEEQYKASPKNASLNQWIGVCLYNMEKYEDSQKYFLFAHSKGILEAPYYLAMIEFYQYNFDKSMDYVEKYKKSLLKEKKEIPTQFNKTIQAIVDAKMMLDHVEKIVVIDSIIVNKKDFFKYYKLAPEIGKLKDTTVLKSNEYESKNPVFVTESNERMIWSANVNGAYSLMESTKLIGDTWDTPRMLSDNLNLNNDACYPYMMPDGITLYYASNGEGSIGGYDIFFTRKNSEDGSFFQPQNVGMPYNSPYDDYLLVIDEFTKAGWWATDRNKIKDKLTIYIFIPNEVRANYNYDDPNIKSLALIKDIKRTWADGENYSDILNKIRNITTNTKQKDKQFDFIVCNGVHYTNIQDFKALEAKNLMVKWISQDKEYSSKKILLDKLRKDYINKKLSELSSKILNIEKDIELLRIEIESTANAVRRAEINNKK